MPLRPKFRRALTILIAIGLCPLAFLYFEGYIEPHIHLPTFTSLGCPILARLHPLSHKPIQPTDSLELVTFGGPEVSGYTITIQGDGTLTRDTAYTLFPSDLAMGCPLHDTDKHFKIPPETAQKVLSKARDGGFCRLCQLYQPKTPKPGLGTDQHLTFTFGGKTNTVYNADGNPPAIFHELAESILPLAPPIPDYAKRSNHSRERMKECIDFDRQQFERMLQRRGQTTH